MRQLRYLYLMMMLLMVTTATAQDDDETLDPAQQAMLDEVRAAVEQQNGWDHYQQFTVTTSRTAWTLTGRNTALWETRNFTAQIDAEIDREMPLIEGEIQWQTEVASSEENTPADERQSMTFTAVEGQVFAQMEGERQTIDISDDLADYQQTGLVAVVAFPPLDNTVGLLDHTVLISDEGISRAYNRRQQQTYRLELDFPESLPHLDFNIDEFISTYNGLVELRAFTDAVMENTVLTLDVTLDVESGQIVAMTLLLQIPVEMQAADVVRVASGNGQFQLDYARQVDTEYTLLDE